MKQLLKLSILISLSVPAFASQSPVTETVIPTTNKSFESLKITKDKDLGLRLFISNLGIKSSKQSPVYNQFYTNKNMKAWVYVQANMYVGDKQPGQVTSTPDGKSYFFVKADTNFFVLTSGLNSQEVLKLSKAMTSGLSKSKFDSVKFEGSSKIRSFAEMFLGQTTAYAEEKCLSQDQIQKRIYSYNDTERKVLESTANCFNGAGSGVWNATGGAVESIYKTAVLGSEQIACGAASVVNATWKRCDEYSTAMKKTVDTTMVALGNIKEVASKAIDGFANLPVEAQAAVLCEMGSTLGTGAAVTFATAGAGAPATLRSISTILEQVADMPGMGKSSATLEKMAEKVTQKAQSRELTRNLAATMPGDIKKSLGEIENLKSRLGKKFSEQANVESKIDLIDQKVAASPGAWELKKKADDATAKLYYLEDPSSAVDFEVYKVAKAATYDTYKESVKDAMKYRKLTPYQQSLANEILSSKRTGPVNTMSPRDASEQAVVSLIADLRKTKIELNPDLKVTPDKLRKELLEEKWKQLELKNNLDREANVIRQDLDVKNAKYLDQVQKNMTLNPAEKEIYRAQVATYATAVACNTVGAAKSQSAPSATQESGVR